MTICFVSWKIESGPFRTMDFVTFQIPVEKKNSCHAIHFLVIEIRSSYSSKKCLRFLFLLCNNLTSFRFICDIGYCLWALNWYTTDCSLINITNGCTYGSDLCLKWISTSVFLIANTDLLIFFSWIHTTF